MGGWRRVGSMDPRSGGFEGWGFEEWGPEGWGPEGWKILRFFPLPPQLSFFLLSLGGLFVEFLVVFEAPPMAFDIYGRWGEKAELALKQAARRRLEKRDFAQQSSRSSSSAATSRSSSSAGDRRTCPAK